MRWSGGCDGAMAAASVPVNIAGKIGSTHAGVMDGIGSRAPANSMLNCAIPAIVTMAVYSQKRTLSATGSQGPQEGMPYAALLEMMVARLRNAHGKKSDSVGCVRLSLRARGVMMKRALIPETRRMNNARSRMKNIFPITSSPRNRCGVECKSNANPPVDIVRVNQAHVTCRTRSLNETFEVSVAALCF